MIGETDEIDTPTLLGTVIALLSSAQVNSPVGQTNVWTETV